MSRIEDALKKATEMEGRFEEPKAPRPVLSSEDPKALSLLAPVRTNVQFGLAGIPNPVVTVCSALPREGVSTIVYYLAQILSADKRTLVVDANFRSPKMHQLLRVDNARGLSDIILEKRSVEECVTSTSITNLELLSSGPGASAAHWFLGSAVARGVLQECRKRADIVLVDAPPLRETPDTAVLGSFTDGVVLVVRARKTKRELVRYAQELLDNAGAHQIGVVLNRMKFWIPGFLYRRL